jgi:putative ABC transport system permease protein
VVKMLDRKLLRDIARLRASILGILAIIALGVACLVALASSYFNLEQARQAYYEQSRLADFWIDVRRAPLAVLDEMARTPGVLALQARIVADTTVTLQGVDEPITARVVSLPAENGPIINDVVLIRGSRFALQAPGSLKRGEVLLNDAFARARRLAPGDTIHVLLNERRQPLHVVGTAIGAEFAYLIPPGGLAPEPAVYAVLYLQHEFADEALGHVGSFNQLVGLLAPGVRQRPAEILRQLELALEPYGVLTVTPRHDQLSHWILSSELQELWNTAVILPGVFLAAAALVLNALIGRLVQQQRATVGTLKAMGYTSGELFAHFAKFGLLLGLAGALLGVAAGHLLSVLMIDVYREFFEFPRLEAGLHPRVAAAGIAVSLTFALLGVLRGARQVMAMDPAQAMRPAPPERGGRSWLEGWRWLWLRLGFRWHTVLRTVTRHPARTFSGLFAAAFGAALVFLSVSLYLAVHYMVDFQFRMVVVSDIDITLREERPIDALLEARRLPGVHHAEAIFTLPCTIEYGHRSRRTAVTGVTPGATLTVPRDVHGRAVPVALHGLTMTRTFAQVLGVGLGDEVILTPIRGDRRSRRIPVAAIVDSFIGMAVYADFDALNNLVGESQAVSGLQLELAPGAGVEEAVLAELKERPAVATVGSNRARRANIERMLVEQMTVSMTILNGFAGVLFFGSVLSASRMSLADRQREVATLRVLGYTPGEIGGIFLRESLVVHIAGALLGLPLGYLLLRAMLSLYDTEVFRIPMVTAPVAWAVPLLLAGIFTLLAHLPVQRSIAKMNWLDVVNLKE